MCQKTSFALWALVFMGAVALGDKGPPSATTPTSTSSTSSGITPTSTTTEGFTTGEDKTTTTTKTKTTTTTTTTPTTTTSTTTTTTTTPNPNEWTDLEKDESEKLVQFVVKEIQKLKMEHKELDDCQKLDLSTVLSGKKQVGKSTKYSVTLKVQPMIKETEACQQQNATFINMHPEICEADVLDGDRGGTEGKTLLRSTCLQVEELQD